MSQLTLSQIAAIIDNKGLPEALFNEILPEQIEDERLRSLWKQIETLSGVIKKIIDEVPYEDA